MADPRNLEELSREVDALLEEVVAISKQYKAAAEAEQSRMRKRHHEIADRLDYLNKLRDKLRGKH